MTNARTGPRRASVTVANTRNLNCVANGNISCVIFPSSSKHFFYVLSTVFKLYFLLKNYLVQLELTELFWPKNKYLFLELLIDHTQKTVSLNQRNIFWYMVKEKVSLNWRKFRWFKKNFFNVNKSISLDQRKFFWINKTIFNSKKFFLSPHIKEMFLWFKETVFSVQWIRDEIC